MGAMKGIRRTAASVVGALLMLGACGVAAAQQPVTGAGGPKPVTGTEEPKQANFDREKVTLKDQVDSAIRSVDSQIDALKKMESTDKDAALQRDKNIEKSLSDLRDGLKDDLDKIDKASPTDWASVRPVVEAELRKAEIQIRTASNFTHVAPRTGAANKQAPNK
jgi:hypothetical protein